MTDFADTVLADAPTDLVVTAEALRARTVRRHEWVACDEAFLDCRIPGSDRKTNYALVGMGVAQNDKQVVHIQGQHGFDLGVASMPHGVVNNLHLHFTAEVFMCFRGEWSVRWGNEGRDGEVILREGDVISVPTWIFRGFTNVGPDDSTIFTALGQDNSGGIVWAPSVMEAAARTGLHLTQENRLFDSVPTGGVLPEGLRLTAPMSAEELAGLRRYTPAEMARRHVQPQDLQWSARALLDFCLPAGGAELAPVAGWGMTQDRDQVPPVAGPHSLSIEWLRAAPGAGVLRHRLDCSQVLIVKEGDWELVLNDTGDEVVSALVPWQVVSVPAGAWRSLRNVGTTPGLMVVMNGGDARKMPQWHPAVAAAALERDWCLDASGYIAPAHLLPTR